MIDCNCSVGAIPAIKQGDDYYIPVHLYFNGDEITDNELPLLDEIEYCFDERDPMKILAAEAYSAAMECFLLPVSQEESFALDEGKTTFDVRVKFYGGNILGVKKKAKMRVLDASSEEVL